MSRITSSLRWFYPGLHVKRWISLAFCGLMLFLVGMGVIIQAHDRETRPLAIRVADWVIHHAGGHLRPGLLGLILSILGALLCIFALARLVRSITSALVPEGSGSGVLDTVYERRRLSQGARIVVIGGGTGLSTMLRGLKRYSANITAIVTVADDGGSSGKLQKQLNILPPGDIRNCLVALADAETQMTELFQYRFRDSSQYSLTPDEHHAPRSENGGSGGYGDGLRDHAFGNLLIAAMCAVNNGDFERAIQETSRVLNVRGRVLPATVAHVRLRAEMEDGSLIEGETNIASSPLKIRHISLVPGDATPPGDVLEAIEAADIIVIGPGSVYTSIIPNLLVRGIPEAIRHSRAKRVYVCNVMTQPGETENFTAYDHVHAIEDHAGLRIFDYVLVNTGQPTRDLLEKYRATGSLLVEPDTDRIKADGYRPLPGNFINQTDVVRHNATILSEAIMGLLD